MRVRMSWEFGEPRAGWLPVTMIVGERRFETIAVSYVPNDALRDFVDLARAVWSEVPSATCVWNTEPVEYEFTLTRTPGGRTLACHRWPDHQRRRGVGKSLFAVTGLREEIGLALWRGLRGLEGRWKTPEYDMVWNWPFPKDAMADLSERVQAWKTGQAE